MIERATWKGILIGIVSGTLLVYIVRPILENLPSAVLRLASATSQRYVNAIVQDAAQPTNNSPLLLLALGLAFILTAAFLGPLLPGGPETAGFPKKVFRGFAIGGMTVVSAVLLFLATLEDSSLSLEHCFRARLSVLAPYLSDREAKELAARWTVMRSLDDLRQVNKRLAEFAEKHNVSAVTQSLAGSHQGRCL